MADENQEDKKRQCAIEMSGNYIARNAVRPRSRMKMANASRRALPTRTRVSVAVAQFNKSRSFHGVTVNQMPATTNP